jgi:hypothetical protein
MTRKPHLALAAVATMALVTLAGCGGGGTSGGGGGTGDGTLRIVVTDAPIDPELVVRADIWVSRITIHDATDNGDTAQAWEPLFDDPDNPIEMNLVDLRNGVTQELVNAQLGAGTYNQVRLFYSMAELELTNGKVYSTEGGADGPIQLTSQVQSGQKIQINPPVVLTDTLDAELLLDFDLSHTFRPIPANNPPDANRYQLGPVIRAVWLVNQAEIRGTITDADEGGAPAVNAAVELFHPGADPELDTPVASTATDELGHYTLIGIGPGTYDIHASLGDAVGSALGVNVPGGRVTTVDIVIATPPGTIEGTVTDPDADPPEVEGATVDVYLQGEGPGDPEVATVQTESDGTYSVDVPPGDYDVYASKDGKVGGPVGATVVSDQITQNIDIEIATP